MEEVARSFRRSSTGTLKLLKKYRFKTMATSLSRQLEQLRSVSSTAVFASHQDGHAKPRQSRRKDDDYLLALQGVWILGDHDGLHPVDRDQVAALAFEAFESLSSEHPQLFQRFRKFFAAAAADIEEPDDQNELEELLVLLSPFMLKKPVQFILQHLLHTKEPHLKCPEVLLASALPHLEYKIFNKIVNCLPIRASAHDLYPRYLKRIELDFFLPVTQIVNLISPCFKSRFDYFSLQTGGWKISGPPVTQRPELGCTGIWPPTKASSICGTKS